MRTAVWPPMSPREVNKMFTMVVGGAASGKSEYAESLVLHGPRENRIYIATMEPFDQECLRRIEKHRAMRARKGFQTVECYRDLSSVRVSRDSTVLLECLGNLCANELYGPSGDQAEEAIFSGVQSLLSQCAHLILVSNEVCSGGTKYAGDTLRYLKLMGRLSCRLACLADHLCEVVCGVPVWHKGGPL